MANNVQFFVYASVDRGGSQSEGTPTPVAQFSSKNDIERHLTEKSGAMNWVILRPTTFMEVSSSLEHYYTYWGRVLIRAESHPRHQRQNLGFRIQAYFEIKADAPDIHLRYRKSRCERILESRKIREYIYFSRG